MTPPLILSATIPGEPFAQPRARSFAMMRKGTDGRSVPVLGPGGRPVIRHYDPKDAVSWKAAAQSHMAAALTAAGLSSPFVSTGPVGLEIRALYACLKGDRRKKPRGLRRKSTRPDVDNLAKAVKDAAKGVLWIDDAQVAEMSIVKLYAPQDDPPRVEIRVWALAEEVEPGAATTTAALLHIAAMLTSRPCECQGNCDTCAPCLSRRVLGVEEPAPPEPPAIRSLFDL